MYKLIKLNGRYTHNINYQYLVEIIDHTGAGIVAYAKMIEWCTAQWGTSIDVEDLSLMRSSKWRGGPKDWNHPFSEEWAYCGRHQRLRIYLTDAAANWFKLSSPIG